MYDKKNMFISKKIKHNSLPHRKKRVFMGISLLIYDVISPNMHHKNNLSLFVKCKYFSFVENNRSFCKFHSVLQFRLTV